MHILAKHALHDVPALCRFIQANPLGIVTTAIKSPKHSTIQSSHVPWVIDTVEPLDEDHLPILRGHLARANPQTQAIVHQLTECPQNWPNEQSTSQRLEDEVLVLFNGPTHHYISPKFYVQTKPESGKVVPTWDYTAVQAYGRATVWFNAKAEETKQFLGRQLRDLSEMSERDIMKFEKPWEVDDAPTSYIDILAKGIIGIQIEVTKLEGRLKLSQDKPIGDREGVVAGLQAHGSPDAIAMAQLVHEQSQLKKQEGKDGFLISTDSSLIPVPELTAVFDSAEFYWAKALPEEDMRDMLAESLCFGVYTTTSSTGTLPKSTPEHQFIGFARCITDFATFAYLTDVWIKPSYQGRGLGKWLIRCVKEVADSMPHLRRIMLFTADWDRSVPFYEETMGMSLLLSPHGTGLAVMECKGKGHPSYGSAGSTYTTIHFPAPSSDAPTWHHEERPRGRVRTARSVPAQLVDELDNNAEAAWRNRDPPKHTISIPQELVLHGDLQHQDFARIAKRADAFVFPNAEAGHNAFGIWAESPEQARVACQAINDWIKRESSSKAATGTSQIQRVRPVTNKLLDKGVKHWVREVRLHRFRQVPLPGTMFEAMGVFHWPVDEVKPQNTLGNSLEALDSIRKAVHCHIFMVTASSIHVVGNIKNVQDGLVRVRKAYRSLKARQVVPARTYLLHWDNTRGTPQNINLCPYEPPQLLLLGRAQSGGVSYQVHDWRVDSGLCQQPQQALQAVEASVEDTLKTVQHYIGNISFRIRLGTFVATSFLRPEARYHKLKDFADMIQQSQFQGEITDEIGDKAIEDTVLSTLKRASTLLEPCHMMHDHLSDVLPLLTSIFHFELPDGNYELTMVWEAVLESSGGGMTYAARRTSWVKLDSDSSLPAQLLDVHVLRLDTGLAWHFDMQATQSIADHRLPERLRPFEARVQLDRDLLQRKIKNKPFVRFGAGEYGLKSLKCSTTHTFRLRESDYLLEVSCWQRWEYPQCRLPAGRAAPKVLEQRWSLAVYHANWDKMLVENRSMRVGETAKWDDGIKVWFPNELHEEDRDPAQKGLQYLMSRLMQVEAAVK
ncbi:hypothetical protein AMS68_007530 [Peltaster fructicola]|uniref:N-acetyltransferase domain-containing protein n=1 Tax=Peltaster fructicola TaxID=286661 RepID=A0A6H0Y4T8_9PEZI|nr:hypothetical protein AMS68_007530 [Peltaster fructicola]